ncbi:MAG: J domain-containing protein [Chloroflexi bacterium]|nr:J domain-containing protein [Chloroflexota bacterium]
MANYYEILGVSRSADEKEIRQAFRRLARKHHPDLNPGDKEAEARFKKINEAYEVLSDPENRKKYDKYGDNWKNADRFEAQHGGAPFEWTTHTTGGNGDFNFDLFGDLDDIFGGTSYRRGGRASAQAPRRGEIEVDVTLEEAFTGSKRIVTYNTGAQQRRIEVAIPPGVDNGSVVRVSPEKGLELNIKVTIEPHSRFQRKGSDLYTEVEVPYLDAVLGGEVEVQTLKGKVALKVRPGSQNGQRVRLAGQGMPRLGSPQTRGDLYVILRPALPKDLSGEERELFEKLRQIGAKAGTR